MKGLGGKGRRTPEKNKLECQSLHYFLFLCFHVVIIAFTFPENLMPFTVAINPKKNTTVVKSSLLICSRRPRRD